jgi:hypothetical protein
MTERAALKKLIRERMARTGESYTTARRHVLAKAGREQAPALPPGLVYTEFGTDQHRVASLIRHACGGGANAESLVAGLAGGIGFMYFVFEYQNTPPMMTIVAQHHPEPWVQAALGRMQIPYTVSHGGKPPWEKLRRALGEGRPVFATVDKSRLPWHGMRPGYGADPYPVAVAGCDGDTLYVDDESVVPHAIGVAEFGAAWSAHKKGRHEMIVPTGPAVGEPDVAGAVATTVAHLTGPVLGNNFDVNFGFSGMSKLAAQLRDTRTKTGWARRFAEPVPFFHGVRRLYECLEVEYTAPGATRPLYAEFLDSAGHPEAAALVRESGRIWSHLATLALDNVAGLGSFADICEEQMCVLMSAGDTSADEVRALGKQADALAAEYGPPGESERRELFDELAAGVESCVDLERRAVALLG